MARIEPSTRSGADAWLTPARQAAIVARLEANRARLYPQLPRTHSSVPDAEGAPDRDRVPGRTVGWSDIGFTLPALMPLALEVHEYEGPRGVGCDLIMWARDGGVVYTKVISVGPESGRSRDWAPEPAEAAAQVRFPVAIEVR